MSDIDKRNLIAKIVKSKELTAVEKRYLEKLVRADAAMDRYRKHIMRRFERKE